MSSPSTPSPAAHPSLRCTITEGKGGHPVRFWSMSSPHIASNQKGSDSGCRSSSPPRPRPRLSSVPSDASTVHTIAIRSPLTTSHHHRMEGRPPRPILGDVIATTSPPIDQQQGRASTVCHSARLVLVLFPVPIFLQMVRGVQRASQGRAIPSSSPRRPSPPCRGASA